MTVSRRSLLRGTGLLAGPVAIAGCLEEDTPAEESPGPDTPTVENPPNAVYVPTHRESMQMLDPVSDGDVTVTPMLSYQHAFWLVDGTSTEAVEPETTGGVHLMTQVCHEPTGTILPVAPGATVRLERDGEQVGSRRSLWTMLSQGMGFHLGDNITLEDDGEYTATLAIPPRDARTTGALDGRFTQTATISFAFTYDKAFRESVVDGVEYHDEDVWGQRGANEPMHGGGTMGPTLSVPTPATLPGTGLGTPTSHDAVFAASLLQRDSRFSPERYVLVSPRTPYNAYPLPAMTLEVVQRRGASVRQRVDLTPTVDDQVGLHYGGALEEIESGDELEVLVHSPPQVARHSGYETAFLDMDPVSYTVP